MEYCESHTVPPCPAPSRPSENCLCPESPCCGHYGPGAVQGPPSISGIKLTIALLLCLCPSGPYLLNDGHEVQGQWRWLFRYAEEGLWGAAFKCKGEGS